MRFLVSVSRVRAVLLWTAAAVSCAVWANTQKVGAHEWAYHVLGSVSETDPATTNWTNAVVDSVRPEPEGALVVPDRLGDWPVTGIRSSAFRNCAKLTSVTLPASVVQIGTAAFSNCTALARVRILAPEVKISARAFSGCMAIEYAEIPARSAFGTVFPDARGSLREAVVVEGTGQLVKSAFANCSNLVSVTLPSTVTNIGASAFANCAALVDLVIPAGVRKVGSKVFDGCASLKSLTFEGDKPESFPSLDAAASDLVVYARRGTAGWEPPRKVTVGGRKVQFLPGRGYAVPPGVAASSLPTLSAGSAADIVGGITAKIARKHVGVLLDAEGHVAGRVVIGVSRKGTWGNTWRFTVSRYGLDGRRTFLARRHEARGDAGPVTVPLSDGVLVFGTLPGGDVAFAGRQGDEILTSGCRVGGDVAGTATFSLEEAYPRELVKTEGGAVARNVEAAYLPLDVEVVRTGTKGKAWRCPKNCSVKYDSSYGAWKWTGKVGDASGTPVKLSGWPEDIPQDQRAGLNFSGLKLSYNPSSGVFQGRYSVYGRTDKGQKKQVGVKVMGVVVNGVGWGVSTVRGVEPWRVYVQ